MEQNYYIREGHEADALLADVRQRQQTAHTTMAGIRMTRSIYRALKVL